MLVHVITSDGVAHCVGHKLADEVGTEEVESGSMMRRFLLLVLAFGCGGDSDNECEKLYEPWELYPQDLEPTDPMGRPWPTYSEALAAMTPCDLIPVFQGTCSDGKRFLQRNGGYTGETRYYDGERLVGITSYSDIIIECIDPQHPVGDVQCTKVVVEEVACGDSR